MILNAFASYGTFSSFFEKVKPRICHLWSGPSFLATKSHNNSWQRYKNRLNHASFLRFKGINFWNSLFQSNFWEQKGINFFFYKMILHNEKKSKIKYIQQCPNWYFVTKKENVKTIVNRITKQNNLKWKVSLELKGTIKVKLK